MKRVLIVLVNWNGWQDTVECLNSLYLLDYPDFRVAVCDNGSTDGSVSKILEWAAERSLVTSELSRNEVEQSCHDFTWLTIIINNENLGFAGGNNVGIRFGLSRGVNYFWLLNNDTVVEPDALSHLIERMQENPQIGICGSTIRLYYARDQIQALGGGYYFRWFGVPWHFGRFSRQVGSYKAIQNIAESRMNYIEGASMLVSRQFVETVGLLCEDYFLYFEEVDLAIRSKGLLTLGYASQSIVYHKVGSSIGTSSNPAKKSLVSDYYNIRNRILFAKRYFPITLPTVYLVLLVEILLRIFCGKWDRAIMIMSLMVSGGLGKSKLS